jgi:hypothetical protein
MQSSIVPTNGLATSLDTAFDIALVPDTLLAEDHMDQADVYLAALSGAPRDRDQWLAQFRGMCASEIPLEKLEKIFKDGHSWHAIEMLRKRVKIGIGKKHAMDVDLRSMHWDTRETYLDLLVCVGAGIGLGPLIPNLVGHHNFSFRLELSRTSRRFTAKHVELGFEPSGAMVWIGRTGAGEDAWLAFVHHETQSEDEEVPRQDESPHSCLTVDQQRRVVMFLASCLKTIAYRDVLVTNQYPDVSNDDEYKRATNVR